MPQTLKFDTRNFMPPTSLKDAMQRSALELNCLLIWMRNEARFHDTMDHNVFDVAVLTEEMIEDVLNEVRTLVPQIEKRVTGADLV